MAAGAARRQRAESELRQASRAGWMASGMAEYALYDERTRRLYVLEQQEMAAQYLGQRIKVTGTLSFDARLNTELLTILSIAPGLPPGSQSEQ